MPVSPRLDRPLFFLPNRVWRCYLGGERMDRFLGCPRAEDAHFPEEWLASATRAENGPNQQHPDEGLSRIRLPDGSGGPLFRDAVLANPEACLGPGRSARDGAGVLCKFLDSAIRLPVQCHPDRAFARRHYRSEHGKAESWIILGGRAIGGVPPYLLMGFKPEVRKEQFAKAVREQDVKTMADSLHRFDIRPGEVWFIPGRLPHAIGSGVFLLEVQEPTDWVVQPERWIGDTQLSDSDMWGPLTPEVGMECFDFESRGTADEIRRRLLLAPTMKQQQRGGSVEEVVGPKATDCFRVDRLTVASELDLCRDAPCRIGILTEGRGRIVTPGGEDAIRQGDCFFVPHAVEKVRFVAEEKLVAYWIAAG